MKHPDSINLILSDSRGIYIPSDFLTDDYNEIAWSHCNAWGLNESNKNYWIDAVNPESEYYWDSWAWVCDNGYSRLETDDRGAK